MSHFSWTTSNADKQRLTGYIPKTTFKILFIDLLSRRGAQIYIIHRLLVAFYHALIKEVQENADADPHDLADILLEHINFNKITTDESTTTPV